MKWALIVALLLFSKSMIYVRRLRSYRNHFNFHFLNEDVLQESPSHLQGVFEETVSKSNTNSKYAGMKPNCLQVIDYLLIVSYLYAYMKKKVYKHEAQTLGTPILSQRRAWHSDYPTSILENCLSRWKVRIDMVDKLARYSKLTISSIINYIHELLNCKRVCKTWSRNNRE